MDMIMKQLRKEYLIVNVNAQTHLEKNNYINFNKPRDITL